MSPIGDELRSALASRTASAVPPPDLYAGIERRARRMRRQKVTASVAGSALAVGAVALGGPMLVSSLTSTAPGPLDSASSAPAAERHVLDPADPWAYRGDPQVLENGSLQAFTREWGVRHGLDEPEVRFVPLHGEVSGPQDAPTAVFLAYGPQVEPHWGVVQSSESGPVLLADLPLAEGTTVLQAAVPGTAAPQLVVLASPDAGRVGYCPTGQGSCSDHGAGGFLRTSLDGDTDVDTVLVVGRNGDVVFDGPAADPGAASAPQEPGDEPAAPSNVLDWPARGGVSAEVVELMLTAYAQETDVSREAVGSRLLYGYQPAGREVAYVLLQVWSGGDARTLAAEFDTSSGTVRSTSLGGVTPAEPAALAVLFPGDTADGPRQLLVVPEPSAGQVLYSPDGRSEPRPVADQGTEAAVLFERAAGATQDRLLVLDGNGDLDRPLYRGTVEELLAATR